MATFGGVNCDFVKGVSTELRESVMTWASPGIDGQGSLLLGQIDGTFEFTLVLYGSSEDVVSWKRNLELLLGTVISVTDDWGADWLNCLVKEVSPLSRTPAHGTKTGSGTYVCRGQLVVRGVVANGAT